MFQTKSDNSALETSVVVAERLKLEHKACTLFSRNICTKHNTKMFSERQRKKKNINTGLQLSHLMSNYIVEDCASIETSKR